MGHKSALCCCKRIRSTRPSTDAEFIFMAHGDSYVNALSGHWWSEKYWALDTKEQFVQMSWFEKYVVAVLVSALTRLGTFLGSSRCLGPMRCSDEAFQLWYPADCDTEPSCSTGPPGSSAVSSCESSQAEDSSEDGAVASMSPPRAREAAEVEAGGGAPSEDQSPVAIVDVEMGSAFEENAARDATPSSIGRRCKGILCPTCLLPQDFVLGSTKGRALKALRASLPNAKRQYPNLHVIGLGAMTKAAFFSNGGADFLDVAEELGCKLVTGNTMTAAVVFENVKRLIPRSAPVWINGATSTIGTALIIAMAQHGYQSITFHSGSEKRAAKLLEIAKNRYHIPEGVIRFCIDDAEFQKFEYCILGSSFALPLDKVARDSMLIHSGPRERFTPRGTPRADVEVEDLEAAGGQASPEMRGDLGEESDDEDNMTPELVRQISINSKPHQRMFGFAFPLPDVPNLIDIGKVIVPPENSVIDHQLLCPKGSMYACALGTAVHAMMRWDFHEFGEIEVSRLESCWSAARKLGCRVISEEMGSSKPDVQLKA